VKTIGHIVATPLSKAKLVTRRDFIFAQPDHAWAGQWYSKLKVGPLGHKLPPIVAHCWR